MLEVMKFLFYLAIFYACQSITNETHIIGIKTIRVKKNATFTGKRYFVVNCNSTVFSTTDANKYDHTVATTQNQAHFTLNFTGTYTRKITSTSKTTATTAAAETTQKMTTELISMGTTLPDNVCMVNDGPCDLFNAGTKCIPPNITAVGGGSDCYASCFNNKRTFSCNSCPEGKQWNADVYVCAINCPWDGAHCSGYTRGDPCFPNNPGFTPSIPPGAINCKIICDGCKYYTCDCQDVNKVWDLQHRLCVNKCTVGVTPCTQEPCYSDLDTNGGYGCYNICPDYTCSACANGGTWNQATHKCDIPCQKDATLFGPCTYCFVEWRADLICIPSTPMTGVCKSSCLKNGDYFTQDFTCA